MQNHKITNKTRRNPNENKRTSIVKKDRIRNQFLRAALYSRKLVLGVGLIKSSAITETLGLKLHLGFMRIEDRIALIIRTNEENAQF